MGLMDVYVGLDYQNWERNSIKSIKLSTIWSTVSTTYVEGHWLRDTYNTGSLIQVLVYQDNIVMLVYILKLLSMVKFLIKQDATTFTSDSVTVKYYAYGVDIGNLYAGVEF